MVRELSHKFFLGIAFCPCHLLHFVAWVRRKLEMLSDPAGPSAVPRDGWLNELKRSALFPGRKLRMRFVEVSNQP